MKTVKTRFKKDKATRWDIECDCGGAMTHTNLSKHLGNKKYVYEHVCGVCGIHEWFDEHYPKVKYAA